MLVSVIMPCNRPEDLNSAIDIFQAQDYRRKELVIIPSGDYEVPKYHNIFVTAAKDKTIGFKRNWGVSLAKGQVIVHQDSDDLYSSDWISRSVSYLLETGSEITGLKDGYFVKDGKRYLYENKTRYQTALLGATLCYHRSFWQKHPFPDKSIGEDKDFCLSASKVIPHNYIDGFAATLHDNNTSSHNAYSIMKLV